MCILCDDSQLHGYHHGPLSNTIVLCGSSLLNLFRLKLTGYKPGGSVVLITVVITLARIFGFLPSFQLECEQTAQVMLQGGYQCPHHTRQNKQTPSAGNPRNDRKHSGGDRSHVLRSSGMVSTNSVSAQTMPRWFAPTVEAC
jgi:hypothetical protein